MLAEYIIEGVVTKRICFRCINVDNIGRLWKNIRIQPAINKIVATAKMKRPRFLLAKVLIYNIFIDSTNLSTERPKMSV